MDWIQKAKDYLIAQGYSPERADKIYQALRAAIVLSDEEAYVMTAYYDAFYQARERAAVTFDEVLLINQKIAKHTATVDEIRLLDTLHQDTRAHLPDEVHTLIQQHF